MKLENLDAVAEAGNKYNTAKSNLEFVRDKSRHYSASSSPAAGTGAVHEDMDGPSGQLASDIRCALIRYREAQLEIAKKKLQELGVEVPDTA